jgi:hypothetical protein
VKKLEEEEAVVLHAEIANAHGVSGQVVEDGVHQDSASLLIEQGGLPPCQVLCLSALLMSGARAWARLMRSRSTSQAWKAWWNAISLLLTVAQEAW